MSTEKPLVNRIAASGLITLKLEEFFPNEPIAILDLKDYLFKGLILKEKDFRENMKMHDWQQYDGAILLVHCSTDAIIPMWAYMLAVSYAAPIATDVFQGTTADYHRVHFSRVINEMDISAYTDQRIIIKGCSDRPLPSSAYLDLTKRLRPIAKSIMYGEPCSTVPIYKKPRK